MQAFSVIDSHCHLDGTEFDSDRDEVLARATAAGVTTVLLPAVDLASARRVAELCDPDAQPRRFASVGVHPHAASEVAEDEEVATALLRQLASTRGVVAIGETGLDYHYDLSPRDAQRASLRLHVRLARELGLPLVLHCREAEQDLLQVLTEEGASAVGGVVHCFTGTAATAHALIEMGFHLGFTGVITFKNAANLRELVPTLPRERILLETDSPYLAPIPYRGRRNEPAFVVKVAETVGAVLGLAPAEAAALADANASRLFGFPALP